MINYTLITGASGGIGYELAKLFAKENHNLVLIARNEKKLAELKTQIQKQYSVNVLLLNKDLIEPEAPVQIFNYLRQQNIRVENLINNAGFGDYGLFHESDRNVQERMLLLNIIALTNLTQLFLSEMVKSGKGKILNLASVAAFMPGPYMSVYYATKAYVLSFSEALASELEGTGVSVTVLCPGPTKTGFEEASSLSDSNLFKIMHVASAKEVAIYGYKAMMKGKKIAIHGILNRILVKLISITPRPLVNYFIRIILGKTKK